MNPEGIAAWAATRLENGHDGDSLPGVQLLCSPLAGMTEWPGGGLQSRLRGFDSLSRFGLVAQGAQPRC
jgi:hypothetical protein